jgi:uncharacterized Fe-S cluster-containing radical SAM superfamily protein
MSAVRLSPPWWSTLKKLASGRVPGQVVIQYTDACNARCTHCGMSVANKFPRVKLTPERVKPLLDALAQQGVMAVSFTGGEPLLYADEVAECIKAARAAGIYSVRTGTNGFFLQGADKPGFEAKVARYAKLLVESGCTNLWISLDAAEPSEHERRRGLPGVVQGMRKGLPIFHEHGLYPAVNLGINRGIFGTYEPGAGFDEDAFYEHFHRAFLIFFAQALELGFTTANLCYPMIQSAFEPGQIVYQAAAEDEGMVFSAREKAPLYRALFDAVTFFRSKLRIFTPRSALLSMIRRQNGEELKGTNGRAGRECGYGCRGGVDFFFVDAAGMRTFPCGYRGRESLAWPMDDEKLPAEPRPLCEQCDWECFRDPSHLFGPLVDAFKRPLTTARRLTSDRAWTKLWLGDLAYYRRCGWFHGCRPPRH